MAYDCWMGYAFLNLCALWDSQEAHLEGSFFESVSNFPIKFF